MTAIIITTIICITLAFICIQGRETKEARDSEDQIRKLREDNIKLKAILIARGFAKPGDFNQDNSEDNNQ